MSLRCYGFLNNTMIIQILTCFVSIIKKPFCEHYVCNAHFVAINFPVKKNH